MLRRISVQDADAHGVAKRLTERAMNVQDRPSCKPAFGQVCILVADALRSSLHPAFTLKVCLERLPRRARLRRSALSSIPPANDARRYASYRCKVGNIFGNNGSGADECASTWPAMAVVP